jgi:hypothetical protein
VTTSASGRCLLHTCARGDRRRRHCRVRLSFFALKVVAVRHLLEMSVEVVVVAAVVVVVAVVAVVVAVVVVVVVAAAVVAVVVSAANGTCDK